MFRFITLIFFLALCNSVSSQQIQRIKYVTDNISPDYQSSNDEFPKEAIFDGRYYVFVQFNQIPDQKTIDQSNIQLLYFIPEKTYLCAIPQDITPINVKAMGMISFWSWQPAMKIAPSTNELLLLNEKEDIELFIQFAKGVSLIKLNKALEKSSIKIIDRSKERYGLLTLSVPTGKVGDLIDLSIITWIEPVPNDPEAIRYKAIGAERVVSLHNPDGENLSGKGVIVGVGDNGKVGTHIDFGNRVTTFSKYGTGTHATHVTGIITGSPNLNPLEGTGTAPGAKIISAYFSDILDRTPDFIRDYTMLMTNNSYGISGSNCDNAGDYSLLSVLVDEQQAEHDSLIHVFSSGNDGGRTCSPYPARFATILHGWQCSKSTFTIGAANHTNGLAGYSSRGPTDDGRIKPEIVAVGSSVRSTRHNNTYGGGSGTSYSSPAMTGITALMYEKYISINNSNPSATLIKALLCNAADDKGKSGPDYQWGYGRVNAAKAVEDLNANQYLSGSVANGDSNSYTITVPANTSKLKVMLMWRDPAAAPFSAPTLVNDLDLVVSDPSMSSFDPWVLDPDPSAVNNIAVRGKDHLNPQEQVTISNPAPGDYSIKIKGSRIPFGPQKFYIVYSFEMDGISVRYPNGGEAFAPSDVEYLRWDAFGHGNESFTIERSLDDGSSWATIASGLSSSTRYYSWTVTGNASKALIRVKTTSYSDVSDNSFHILGVPSSFTATTPCEGYTKLTWNSVATADHYGIYQYNDSIMSLIDSTLNLEYEIGGLLKTKKYWWTVAAMDTLNNASRKATSKSLTPSGGTCDWPDDIALDEVITQTFSRRNTSTDFGSDVMLKVALKNAGNTQIDTFTVSYQIDGGPIIDQSIRDTILSGDTAHFTFNHVENFISGTYEIIYWVDLDGDSHHDNDTLYSTLRVISNDPVTLPYIDGFETADSFDIQKSYDGLPGLDRWDFSTINGKGRIRSFAGQDFIQEGEHALTMDANLYGTYSTNHLILTLNMSNYDTLSDDIRLQFDYMHHEVVSVNNSNDRVWIRGSDNLPWIEIYNLFTDQGTRGIYNLIRLGLPVTDSLISAGQNFGSSFQVRFGQEGNASATEITAEDGYTFDNIKLVDVSNDLAVVEILHPKTVSCGLSTEFPIIKIQNFSSDDADKVIANYRINGGAIVAETILLIDGESIYDHTFATGYDFSAIGQYEMDVWIEYSLDNFRDNDSIHDFSITNQPIVVDFPYTEGFEGQASGWYTDGTQTSWEKGNPGAGIIDHAAEGEGAWVTNLTGDYNHDEFSYLYSPCFDLSGFSTPMLSFAFIYELEDNYDYGWVEYSTDGVSWMKLGAKGEGVNWYNDNKNAWDVIKAYWHVATIEIPVTDTATMFRWVLQTDVGLELEGMGIDQISIYEHDTIYNASNIDSMMTNISGNDWIEVDSNGQRIIAIRPNGQDLGVGKISLYKYSGAQRYDTYAYYADRSFIIQTDSTPNSPVDVRLYFTNVEAESIRTASECDDCISLDDAFQVEIMKYNDTVEDSIQSNNNGGNTFWYPEDSVEVVPFEDGYYVEFSVDSFSEFWITGPKLQYVDSLVSGIRRSSDDAEEHNPSGSVNPFSKTIELIQDIDEQTVGLRFDNLNIPKGSYINNAWIQTRATDTISTSGMLQIKIENSDNTSTFNTGNYDISLKPVLNSSATWYLPEWPTDNEAGDLQRSPELRKLVEQIIDRPNWSPGNALSLILTGSGRHSVFAFDSVREHVAQLHVIYDSICQLDHIVYVDADANGFQDGSSWPNAFRTISEAFELADDCSDINEIWLKEGTYLPSTGSDRDLSFVLPQGIQIYGGFDGTETMRSQRDYNLNLSIMSGDIGIMGDSLDNVYHVVFNGVGADTSLIDGIFIRHGTANGIIAGEDSGAGLVNNGLLILRNSNIDICAATLHGTAILNSGGGAELIIEDCIIKTGPSNADGEIYNTLGATLIFKGVSEVK